MSGITLTNTDNAIYGESYLYEIHSKKYGFIPINSTDMIFQALILSPQKLYNKIPQDNAKNKTAIICVNGETSDKYESA